ncbi:hypothetical protein C9374_003494 [Naegleria lovaniensis]|uniref:Uncharacterized protein n=1 Tax=Naegleria lovaniensis TaxID=51637 RepID=A0AA88GT67_NAELO|nr:uncharacterized protein C9374_003494 [Naegleria lovaniensis]KAG2385679.1 hypothetical protein C9374_003494 [Naegleria lovaniensis]
MTHQDRSLISQPPTLIEDQNGFNDSTTVPSTSTTNDIHDCIRSSEESPLPHHTTPSVTNALNHSLQHTMNLQHFHQQLQILQPYVWNYLMENEKEKQKLRNEIDAIRTQNDKRFGNDLKSLLQETLQLLSQKLNQHSQEEMKQRSEDSKQMEDLFTQLQQQLETTESIRSKLLEKKTQELLESGNHQLESVTNIIDTSFDQHNTECRSAHSSWENEIKSLEKNVDALNTSNLEILHQVLNNQQWAGLFDEVLKCKKKDMELRDELLNELKDRHVQEKELWALQNDNLHQYAQELENVIEQLRGQVQQQDETIQSLQEAFEDLEQEQFCVTESHARQVAELTQQYEFEMKEMEMRSALEKRQIQDQQLENSLALKTFIGQQEVEITKLRKEIAMLNREKESLSQHCDNIETELQEQIIHLESQVLELDQHNHELTYTHEQELESTRVLLQNQYSQQIEELQNEISKKNESLELLETELQILRERENEYQQEQNHLLQELHLMKQLYEDQTKELEFYKRAHLSHLKNKREVGHTNKEEEEQDGENVGSSISITSYIPSHKFCQSSTSPRNRNHSSPSTSPSNPNKLKFLAPSRNGLFM